MLDKVTSTQEHVQALPVVHAAIRKAWPDQADEIIAGLHHNASCGCYGFERWGMYVGVEYDGYIHT